MMEISGSYIVDLSEALDVDVPASKILPERSKMKYESAYKQFKDWCLEKKIDFLTETVMLSYLEEKSKTMKPSTLWAIYSMLKTTLRIKDNVDIRRFKRLTPFLKKKSIGHRAKKSKILTTEQINQFICEADNQKYLLMKIVLIMGVSGRCGRDELVRMTIDDIEDRGSVLIVQVHDSKTENQIRTFTIIDLNYIELYRMYAALRPALASNRRFFFKYHNGKCCNQVVGINKIGTIPSLIARYLKLQNPKAYTAHCFRKRPVSSTSGVPNGVDVIATTIKHEKSVTPPPRTLETSTLIEDSVDNKIQISNKILEFEISDSNVQVTQRDIPSASKSEDSSSEPVRATLSSSGIKIGTCNNCTINFNFIKK